MKKIGIIFAIAMAALMIIVSCGKKMKMPTEVSPGGNLGDTLYLMINPPWDTNHGYNFASISCIYFGHDTYLYVADTGNNRILQMDVAGTIHEQFNIPHPISISQDELMRLLVVTGEKKIYRIDIGPSGDRIPKVVYEMGNSVYGYSTMHKDSTLIDSTDRFLSITDIPDNDRSYYVAVSSPTMNDGRILWFWGSREHGEHVDSLFDHKFAYFDTLRNSDGDLVFDSQFGNTIGVANGDTFMNPVVLTGNGIASTTHPNSIYAYESGSALHLLVCQDSGSFPVHDMRYEVQIHNYSVYWTFGVSQYPGQSDMLMAGAFDKPSGVTMDPHGNIYIVDSGSNRNCGAYKFSKTGGLLNTFCEPDSIDPFHNPCGISYDIFGDRRTVYIADTDSLGASRIMRFKLSTDLEP